MLKKRVPLTLIALSLAVAAELAIGLSGISPSQAQFKPPNRGTPKTTAGGATRSGSCIKDKIPLTVLVPSSNNPGLATVAQTTEARPTFFLYLPKTTAQAAEFVLKDVDDNDVYRTPIALPGKPGIVSFRLPADAAPLELGKEYQWFFNVVCQPNDRLRDGFAAAWIQRVEPNPSLVRALKTATPRKRPNIYAQAGIWQDTLATLSELQRTNPSDRTLTKEWNDLLKSVGLGQIPQSPAVGQLSLGTIKP